MDEEKLSDVWSNFLAMREKSAELKARAQRTLETSAVVIDRSRRLLSVWPVSRSADLADWDTQGGYREFPGPHQPHEEPARAGAGSADAGRAQGVGVGGGLERVVDQTFHGDTVRLDGRHFVDCQIEQCLLDYSGGPVVLEGTQLTGCRFRFGGEAAMTVSVLECFGLIEQKFETAGVGQRAGRAAVIN